MRRRDRERGRPQIKRQAQSTERVFDEAPERRVRTWRRVVGRLRTGASATASNAEDRHALARWKCHRGVTMKRREFVTFGLSAAAAWPSSARAQGAMPVVGFLNPVSPDTYSFNAVAFRDGLAKAGFVEGRNVRIEYRWGKGDYGALPALAAELAAMNVAAIAATGDIASARAAQGATSTI